MKSGRQKEPRIVDPETYPRRFVSLRVAAIYLEIDVKTLDKFLAAGLLEYVRYGSRRKVAVSELVAFQERQRVQRRIS